MTARQIKQTLAKYCSVPGYVDSISSRSEFDDFFYEHAGIDILEPPYDSCGDSMANRFKSFLSQADEESINLILTELDNLQG